jgi:anti-anti-sigma factor
MPEAPVADPVAIETIGDNAVVARVNIKLFDDKTLKHMNDMIEQAATKPGVIYVVLDMSRVQIVPSLGLGALVQLSNRCKKRQQRLKLAGVQPMVRQTMAITKLDRILDLTDTVDEALG